MAFRKKVTTQAVRDLAGIDSIVLLLGRCDRPQHHRMRHLHLCGLWKQMIVDPAREYACFHCHRPGLRKCLRPAIQLRTSRRNRPFPLNLTTYIFDAVADRLLANVEPNVIHMFVEEPPWLFSGSTSPLSSAFCTPRAPRSTYIQTSLEEIIEHAAVLPSRLCQPHFRPYLGSADYRISPVGKRSAARHQLYAAVSPRRRLFHLMRLTATDICLFNHHVDFQLDGGRFMRSYLEVLSGLP